MLNLMWAKIEPAFRLSQYLHSVRPGPAVAPYGPSHDASGAAPRLRAPSTTPSTAARASAPSRSTRTAHATNASPPR
eukprot:1382633-Prymnesium_polylepis.1